ncbi:MAG: hypothetical protein IM537_15160 [Pseudanabaena sp. M57BS1SP1A06MG]|nr:hypothetical protein [Pseudanabaena sp. M53BS1SP1A06MG]MCA6583255.1 hypothetical protein [Pseudanabaena sp. M34BS1SP1A06MG]MCA6591029.1 hypothetical protein [Pseudanabaena sp. M38BS1SP1A06MG]MCA6601502.1 hypothetical protein [Pseudanabaena sp. M57BS1SP1A06MG]
MIILSSSEIQKINLLTPWGDEKGIYYLGKTFLPINFHPNLEEAIASCRRDLDEGMLSIVVDEGDRVSLWWYFSEYSFFQASDVHV